MKEILDNQLACLKALLITKRIGTHANSASCTNRDAGRSRHSKDVICNSIGGDKHVLKFGERVLTPRESSLLHPLLHAILDESCLYLLDGWQNHVGVVRSILCLLLRIRLELVFQVLLGLPAMDVDDLVGSVLPRFLSARRHLLCAGNLP